MDDSLRPETWALCVLEAFSLGLLNGNQKDDLRVVTCFKNNLVDVYAA